MNKSKKTPRTKHSIQAALAALAMAFASPAVGQEEVPMTQAGREGVADEFLRDAMRLADQILARAGKSILEDQAVVTEAEGKYLKPSVQRAPREHETETPPVPAATVDSGSLAISDIPPVEAPTPAVLERIAPAALDPDGAGGPTGFTPEPSDPATRCSELEALRLLAARCQELDLALGECARYLAEQAPSLGSIR